jgi:poly-gamma-glutamate synthesis protein (capsule biosynthesis protein)
MHIIVSGDYCDNSRVDEFISRSNYDILFQHVKAFLHNADFRIVNFEFPIVLNGSSPIKKAGPSLKGQQKAVDAIKSAGFNVCTLANNHILDQGEKCCIETKQLIEAAGLSTVGVGKNIEEASHTLLLECSGETIAVINCCEHEFSIATEKSAGANPLNPIQQYYKIQEARSNADYVLVIVHGGHEMCQYPSPRMKETYRFFVDSGADAVVNHHQHCYSGYEVYHGKPIFYGLGNFLFDWEGKRNGLWNEGYMVSLDFVKGQMINFRLFPYTQCNDEPGVKLMQGNAFDVFGKRIQEINEIIADNRRLKNSWESWIKNNSKYITMDYQPYRSRLTQGLFVRGLLPSFISKKRNIVLLII